MPYDKTKPYACPCCGYWNDDMKYDYYRHKEPLVENEEIRRVIRCLGFEKIAFTQLGLTWRAYDANLAGGFELVIKTKPFDTCEDGGIYDIEELCGEEEE